MTKNSGQNPKRQLIPPNLIAFLSGVVLAIFLGLIFRKIIDKMGTNRSQATLRAQATPTPEASSDISPRSLQTEESQSKANEQSTQEKETESITDTVEKKTATPEAGASPTTTQGNNNPKPNKSETEIEISPLGEVDYLAWRRLFRSLEEMLTQSGFVLSNSTLTPRYRHQAKGLAITRGQFLDVVSRRMPSNLPTRPISQGLVLHALSSTDFDTMKFTKAVSDSGTQLENLCRNGGKTISLERKERVTVIVSNTQPFFQCLQNWLSSKPNFSQVTELSLIGFTHGSTFFGSITSNKKLFSLQMWNTDWLLENTVALEETGQETVQQRRSLRLANVTRALGQPSDVRMQIPASTRSLSGPLVEPKDVSPAKPLVIGNFALVPSHMPRGNLIATSYSVQHPEQGKSVSVTPPEPGRAKALVLATQGKKLKFLTLSKESREK